MFGQRPDSFIWVFLDTNSYNYSHVPCHLWISSYLRWIGSLTRFS
ncbi:DUF6688 domain-containing protein [Bacillus massiliglaciei]